MPFITRRTIKSSKTETLSRCRRIPQLVILLLLLIAIALSPVTASNDCATVGVEQSKDGSCVAPSEQQQPIGDATATTASTTAGMLKRIKDSIVKHLSGAWRSSSASADQLKFLIAGAIAGIVSRTAVSPLEVIATAQMVTGGSGSNKGGLANELRALFAAEGVRGFFKGNGANCLKVAPTRGIQFFAFEQFKSKLVDWKRDWAGVNDDDDVALTPVERLVAGGFAGMIASSCVYPLEVVKTMLTMYPGKYPGIVAAFRGVVTEAGYKGLYQGLAPTLVAMFPYVGMEFMIYETAKIALEKMFDAGKKATDDSEASLPVIVSLGLGAVAGAVAQTSAHPFDVVRKRLQVQGINGNPVLYKSTMECFVGLAGKEGYGALYKGLGPACVATIPGTGIAYITYEFMKNVLGLSSV
mmetsp:Transcript_48254/g.58407  ORF Transcript_48254/g.58407 Transcript_48254/m.58407 type:complete len:412 (+) Transcript_48254:239-1474(+)